MKWVPFTGMTEMPVGPKIFRYAAITNERHPSNNRRVCYDTDFYFRRYPSHYAMIEPPEGETE